VRRVEINVFAGVEGAEFDNTCFMSMELHPLDESGLILDHVIEVHSH
jgi:hypothetical protein